MYIPAHIVLGRNTEAAAIRHASGLLRSTCLAKAYAGKTARQIAKQLNHNAEVRGDDPRECANATNRGYSGGIAA
jgi:hypothetical protein